MYEIMSSYVHTWSKDFRQHTTLTRDTESLCPKIQQKFQCYKLSASSVELTDLA